MNFDNIVLEKGMYTNPDKSFSEIKDNYMAKPLKMKGEYK